MKGVCFEYVFDTFFCVVVGQKKKIFLLLLRDMYSGDRNDDINDDDDGFSIGVKNAGRVSSLSLM